MTESQQLEWLRSAQLTPQQTFAMSLRLGYGWSHKDIAERMGFSRATATRILDAAEKKLRSVGIPVPEKQLARIRRAQATDPSHLDTSTEIIGVA